MTRLAIMVAALSVLTSPAQADGCFVLPFVWNKPKDINEPTQKAIIVYDGSHEVLILQVMYEGSVKTFRWLIPVPAIPKVIKASMECFYELSRYTHEHMEAARLPRSILLRRRRETA